MSLETLQHEVGKTTLTSYCLPSFIHSLEYKFHVVIMCEHQMVFKPILTHGVPFCHFCLESPDKKVLTCFNEIVVCNKCPSINHYTNVCFLLFVFLQVKFEPISRLTYTSHTQFYRLALPRTGLERRVRN